MGCLSLFGKNIFVGGGKLLFDIKWVGVASGILVLFSNGILKDSLKLFAEDAQTPSNRVLPILGDLY